MAGRDMLIIPEVKDVDEHSSTAGKPRERQALCAVGCVFPAVMP